MVVVEEGTRIRCAFHVCLEDILFQRLRNPVGAFLTSEQDVLTLQKQFVNRAGHFQSKILEIQGVMKVGVEGEKAK
jgi:hypothetical protein